MHYHQLLVKAAATTSHPLDCLSSLSHHLILFLHTFEIQISLTRLRLFVIILGFRPVRLLHIYLELLSLQLTLSRTLIRTYILARIHVGHGWLCKLDCSSMRNEEFVVGSYTELLKLARNFATFIKLACAEAHKDCAL